ncbi:hypothetical protein SAMN02745751_01175 [Dethiosulfatibacter aminovorans DSM 17477]|uniref:Nucleotidase n=1 Tax=Dethiosulfatibacter aminovorans DSM 17477 TaxID=1121476 RepID=A0A1M6EFB7_9FIRM|nr:hypothetical protein [Dethiosulfatibacter aminovorans]SHI83988.1 hypothetical protein SAMN02745751_01175 [Dethiosulfatibacter aminovorans DSM 17477]
MKRLNICIDIDGTLTEPYYWLAMANEHFSKCVREEEVRCYEIHKTMGIELDDYLYYYEVYKYDIHNNARLREQAGEYIGKLSEWHRIHFVTARDKDLEMITFSYLCRHNIPFNSLYVTGNANKIQNAHDLNCDVFLEDSMDNAVQLARAGYKVILMDAGYNQCPEEELHSLIVRVHTWEEAYEVIQAMAMTSQAIS